MTVTEQAPVTPREWPDLRRGLAENGGVLPVPVETLRGLAAGWQRTRLPDVRQEILERLDDMGAGVWPELPERRAIGTVVLYARGTEAHEMIRCFEAGTITPLFVKLLRRLNEPPTDRLQVAREIVERTAAMIESQMLTDEPERARWRGWWKRNEP